MTGLGSFWGEGVEKRINNLRLHSSVLEGQRG